MRKFDGFTKSNPTDLDFSWLHHVPTFECLFSQQHCAKNYKN